jgi:hypothetical protein
VKRSEEAFTEPLTPNPHFPELWLTAKPAFAFQSCFFRSRPAQPESRFVTSGGRTTLRSTAAAHLLMLGNVLNAA